MNGKSQITDIHSRSIRELLDIYKKLEQNNRALVLAFIARKAAEKQALKPTK